MGKLYLRVASSDSVVDIFSVGCVGTLAFPQIGASLEHEDINHTKWQNGFLGKDGEGDPFFFFFRLLKGYSSCHSRDSLPFEGLTEINARTHA